VKDDASLALAIVSGNPERKKCLGHFDLFSLFRPVFRDGCTRVGSPRHAGVPCR
jgi:hypothetical protein